MLAAKYGHEACVGRLIAAGAKLDLLSKVRGGRAAVGREGHGGRRRYGPSHAPRCAAAAPRSPCPLPLRADPRLALPPPRPSALDRRSRRRSRRESHGRRHRHRRRRRRPSTAAAAAHTAAAAAATTVTTPRLTAPPSAVVRTIRCAVRVDGPAVRGGERRRGLRAHPQRGKVSATCWSPDRQDRAT